MNKGMQISFCCTPSV